MFLVLAGAVPSLSGCLTFESNQRPLSLGWSGPRITIVNDNPAFQVPASPQKYGRRDPVNHGLPSTYRFARTKSVREREVHHSSSHRNSFSVSIAARRYFQPWYSGTEQNAGWFKPIPLKRSARPARRPHFSRHRIAVLHRLLHRLGQDDALVFNKLRPPADFSTGHDAAVM